MWRNGVDYGLSIFFLLFRVAGFAFGIFPSTCGGCACKGRNYAKSNRFHPFEDVSVSVRVGVGSVRVGVGSLRTHSSEGRRKHSSSSSTTCTTLERVLLHLEPFSAWGGVIHSIPRVAGDAESAFMLLRVCWVAVARRNVVHHVLPLVLRGERFNVSPQRSARSTFERLSCLASLPPASALFVCQAPLENRTNHIDRST